MRSDRTLQCPHCDEQFEKSEAAYTVCLTCGQIYPPGDSPTGHGPGPGAHRRGEADLFGECCSAYHEYSVEDALERQADVREKKGEEFAEHDVTPPWERDGFEENWLPEDEYPPLDELERVDNEERCHECGAIINQPAITEHRGGGEDQLFCSSACHSDWSFEHAMDVLKRDLPDPERGDD